MAGNLLLGGVIGLGVDAATGAAKDLTPNPVHAILEQEGEESVATANDEIATQEGAIAATAINEITEDKNGAAVEE